MWGGRFSGSLNERMKLFNDSFPFDRRMWAEDIRGSIAWARQIASAGVVTEAELGQLIEGLEAVYTEFAEGRFQPQPSDEDIHTAVERRLGELGGPVAGKLHTGRSRNDQVATDTRLWVLGAIERLDAALREVQAAILAQAEAAGNALIPGYTHMQRAQPLLLSHWLLSHFWPLQRDRERLADCRKRVAVLPLGSAALAGTPLKIDRAALAAELGFDQPSPNSVDAVSDRDFAAEFLFATALIGVHLSRVSEDLIIYSTSEFGFVTLADAYSTGSSIMPQKKNPDSLELARGKSGRLIGNLVGLLTILKGMPSSYDKDMQEDKEPLFDSADTLELCLAVVAGAIGTATFHHQRMRAALDAAILATDVADYMVDRGVAFREAHRAVGALVRAAEQQGIPMAELPLETFKATHPALGDDIHSVFDLDRSVAARRVQGATGPEAVQQQIVQAHACLG